MEMEFERESERSIDATTLAVELVEGRATLREVLEADEYASVADDIQDQIDRFGRFSSRAPVLPCITYGAALPIPLDASHVRGYDSSSWQRNANALRLEVEAGTGLRVEMIASRAARDFFVERIARFLGIRSGGTGMVTARTLSDTGLEVKVSTRTSGGRVFYSPATLFTRSQLFGAPTSPVTRPVLPGIYLFGVENRAGAMQWDHAEYDVPPFYDIRLSL